MPLSDPVDTSYLSELIRQNKEAESTRDTSLLEWYASQERGARESHEASLRLADDLATKAIDEGRDTDFNYADAKRHNTASGGNFMYDEESGHWASRIPSGPREGLLLKAPWHETYDVMIQEELNLGNLIVRKGNNEYSQTFDDYHKARMDKFREEGLDPSSVTDPFATTRQLQEIGGEKESRRLFELERAGNRRSLREGIAASDPDKIDLSREGGRRGEPVNAESWSKVTPEEKATKDSHFMVQLGVWYAQSMLTPIQEQVEAAAKIATGEKVGDIITGLSMGVGKRLLSGAAYLLETPVVDALGEATFGNEFNDYSSFVSGLKTGAEISMVPENEWQRIPEMAVNTIGIMGASTAAAVGTTLATGNPALGLYAAGSTASTLGYGMGASAANSRLDLHEYQINTWLAEQGYDPTFKITDKLRKEITIEHGMHEALWEGVGQIVGLKLWGKAIRGGEKIGKRLPIGATPSGRYASLQAFRNNYHALKTSQLLRHKLPIGLAERMPYIGAAAVGEGITEVITEIGQTQSFAKVDPDAWNEMDLWGTMKDGMILSFLMGPFAGAVQAAGGVVEKGKRSKAAEKLWGYMGMDSNKNDPIKDWRTLHAPTVEHLQSLTPEERAAEATQWAERQSELQDEANEIERKIDELGTDDIETRTRMVKELENVHQRIQVSIMEQLFVEDVQMGLGETVEITTSTPDKVIKAKNTAARMNAKKHKGTPKTISKSKAESKNEKRAEQELADLNLEVVWFEGGDAPAFFDPSTEGVVYLQKSNATHWTMFKTLGLHEAGHDVQYHDADLHRELSTVLGNPEILAAAEKYIAAGDTANDALAMQLIAHIKDGGTLETFEGDVETAMTWIEQEGFAVALQEGTLATHSTLGKLFSRLGFGTKKGRANALLMNALQKAKRAEVAEGERVAITEWGARQRHKIAQAKLEQVRKMAAEEKRAEAAKAELPTTEAEFALKARRLKKKPRKKAAVAPPPTIEQLFAKPKQKITSVKTIVGARSETYLGKLFRSPQVEFKDGTINANLAAGTSPAVGIFMEEQGVTNYNFDPFALPDEQNQTFIDNVSNGRADTATVSNGLNVIKEKAARRQLIAQASNVIKEDGVAYFTVYVGDGTGVGKATTKGWQENRNTADYVSEIEELFDSVEAKGGVISATQPSMEARDLFTEIKHKAAARAAVDLKLSDLPPAEFMKGLKKNKEAFDAAGIKLSDFKMDASDLGAVRAFGIPAIDAGYALRTTQEGFDMTGAYNNDASLTGVLQIMMDHAVKIADGKPVTRVGIIQEAQVQLVEGTEVQSLLALRSELGKTLEGKGLRQMGRELSAVGLLPTSEHYAIEAELDELENTNPELRSKKERVEELNTARNAWSSEYKRTGDIKDEARRKIFQKRYDDARKELKKMRTLEGEWSQEMHDLDQKLLGLEEEMFTKLGLPMPDSRTQGHAGKLLRSRLDTRAQSILGVVDENHTDEQVESAMASAMAEELLWADEHGEWTAKDWYADAIARMWDSVVKLEPSLTRDSDEGIVFSLMIALMSNGEKVDSNLKLSLEGFRNWRNTGKFPAKGSQLRAVDYGKLEALFEFFGSWQDADAWLQKKSTVGEINAELKVMAETVPAFGKMTIKGELVSEEAWNALVLGPKLGAFYLNNRGNFEPVTQDVWFARSFYRTQGLGSLKNADFQRRNVNRLTELVAAADGRELSSQAYRAAGRTRAQAAMATVEESDWGTDKTGGFHPDMLDNVDSLVEWIEKASSEFAIANFPKWGEIADSQRLFYVIANEWSKREAKGKEAPSGGKVRAQARRVLKDAVGRFNKKTDKNISPAAAQAMLWYFEKELYTRYSSEKTPFGQDYGTVAANLVSQESFLKTPQAMEAREFVTPRVKGLWSELGESKDFIVSDLPDGIRQPFGATYKGEVDLDFDTNPSEDLVELSVNLLRDVPKRRGRGTEAMKALMPLLDKHGVDAGVVISQETEADAEGLSVWLAGFGFVGDENAMYRTSAPMEAREIDPVYKGNLGPATLYPKVIPVLDAMRQRKMKPAELKKYLTGKGITKDETYWTGLDSWLEMQGDNTISIDDAMSAVTPIVLTENYEWSWADIIPPYFKDKYSGGEVSEDAIEDSILQMGNYAEILLHWQPEEGQLAGGTVVHEMASSYEGPVGSYDQQAELLFLLQIDEELGRKIRIHGQVLADAAVERDFDYIRDQMVVDWERRGQDVRDVEFGIQKAAFQAEVDAIELIPELERIRDTLLDVKVDELDSPLSKDDHRLLHGFFEPRLSNIQMEDSILRLYEQDWVKTLAEDAALDDLRDDLANRRAQNLGDRLNKIVKRRVAGGYEAAHAKEENNFAWLRTLSWDTPFGERTDLFVIEAQSDWANESRRRQFMTPVTDKILATKTPPEEGFEISNPQIWGARRGESHLPRGWLDLDAMTDEEFQYAMDRHVKIISGNKMSLTVSYTDPDGNSRGFELKVDPELVFLGEFGTARTYKTSEQNEKMKEWTKDEWDKEVELFGISMWKELQKKAKNALPMGPFVATPAGKTSDAWLGVVAKRMIAEAADKGNDGVVITSREFANTTQGIDIGEEYTGYTKLATILRKIGQKIDPDALFTEDVVVVDLHVVHDEANKRYVVENRFHGERDAVVVKSRYYDRRPYLVGSADALSKRRAENAAKAWARQFRRVDSPVAGQITEEQWQRLESGGKRVPLLTSGASIRYVTKVADNPAEYMTESYSENYGWDTGAFESRDSLVSNINDEELRGTDTRFPSGARLQITDKIRDSVANGMPMFGNTTMEARKDLGIRMAKTASLLRHGTAIPPTGEPSVRVEQDTTKEYWALVDTLDNKIIATFSNEKDAADAAAERYARDQKDLLGLPSLGMDRRHSMLADVIDLIPIDHFVATNRLEHLRGYWDIEIEPEINNYVHSLENAYNQWYIERQQKGEVGKDLGSLLERLSKERPESEYEIPDNQWREMAELFPEGDRRDATPVLTLLKLGMKLRWLFEGEVERTAVHQLEELAKASVDIADRLSRLTYQGIVKLEALESMDISPPIDKVYLDSVARRLEGREDRRIVLQPSLPDKGPQREIRRFSETKGKALPIRMDKDVHPYAPMDAFKLATDPDPSTDVTHIGDAMWEKTLGYSYEDRPKTMKVSAAWVKGWDKPLADTLAAYVVRTGRSGKYKASILYLKPSGAFRNAAEIEAKTIKELNAEVESHIEGTLFPLVEEAVTAMHRLDIFMEDTALHARRLDGTERMVSVTGVKPEHLRDLVYNVGSVVMPSVATVDTRREMPFFGTRWAFGDIFFVWDPDVARPEASPTWTGDAYTVPFPRVTQQNGEFVIDPSIDAEWRQFEYPMEGLKNLGPATPENILAIMKSRQEERGGIARAEVDGWTGVATGVMRTLVLDRVETTEQMREELAERQGDVEQTFKDQDALWNDVIHEYRNPRNRYRGKREDRPMQSIVEEGIYSASDAYNRSTMNESVAQALVYNLVTDFLEANPKPEGVRYRDYLAQPETISKLEAALLPELGPDVTPKTIKMLQEMSTGATLYFEGKPQEIMKWGKGGVVAVLLPKTITMFRSFSLSVALGRQALEGYAEEMQVAPIVEELKSLGVQIRYYDNAYALTQLSVAEREESFIEQLDSLEDSVMYARRIPEGRTPILNSPALGMLKRTHFEERGLTPADRTPFSAGFRAGARSLRQLQKERDKEERKYAVETERQHGKVREARRLANQREVLQDRIDRVKLKALEAEQLRETAITLVKLLPKKERGSLAVRLARVKTPKRLGELADRAVELAAEAEYKSSVARLRSLKTRLRKRKVGMNNVVRQEVDALIAAAEVYAYQPDSTRMKKGLSPADHLQVANEIAAKLDEAVEAVKIATIEYRASREDRSGRLGVIVSDLIDAVKENKERPVPARGEQVDRKSKVWFRRSKTTMSMIEELVQKASPEVSGAVADLLHHNLTDAESNHLSEIRNIFQRLDRLAKQAGYKNFDIMMDAAGTTDIEAVTQTVEVTLGGSSVELTLDELMKIMATDAETVAMIVDELDDTGEVVRTGTGIQFKAGRNVAPIMGITRAEWEMAMSKLPRELQNFVRVAKQLREELRDPAFKAYFQIHGTEPRFVVGYEPRSRERTPQRLEETLDAHGATATAAFLDDAGFTKQRAAGGQAVMIGGFIDDFISSTEGLSKLAHMAVPIRDAFAIVTQREVRDAINTHFGGEFVTDLEQRLLHAAGMVQRVPRGFLSKISGGLARAFLTLRPRTWGRILFGGVANLSIQMSVPKLLIGVGSLTNIKANLRDAWNNSGYLYARSRSGAMRRQTQEAEQTAGRIADQDALMASVVKIAKTLVRGSEHLLRGDISAAQKSIGDIAREVYRLPDSIHVLQAMDNVIVAIAYGSYLSEYHAQGLRGEALIKAAAVAAERVMRQTQNTSSPMDATVLDAMDAVKGGQARAAFPFVSDPVTKANAIYRAMRFGTAKQRALAVQGFITTIATNMGVTFGYGLLLKFVAELFMDDDEDMYEEQARAIVDRANRKKLIESTRANAIDDILGQFGYAGIIASWGMSALEGYDVGNPQLWASVTEDLGRLSKRLADVATKEDADEGEVMEIVGEILEVLRMAAGDPTVMPLREIEQVREMAKPSVETVEKARRKLKRKSPLDRLLGIEPEELSKSEERALKRLKSREKKEARLAE